MRWIHLRWLFGLILAVALGSPVMAADLGVAPQKTVVHVHRHKLVRIHRRAVVRLVRDYDGTPITMRRRPDGTDDTHFAERFEPDTVSQRPARDGLSLSGLAYRCVPVRAPRADINSAFYRLRSRSSR